MLSHRLLLTLLSPARRQGRQGGFSLLSGLVVILVLITGSLALVSVTTGDLLGSGRRSTSRDAFATAEAGADLIIASLNQPENRRLLVAGQPLSAWASAGANPALRSPCTLPDGSGPGADGTGQPSQRATRFATGTFQPLDDSTLINLDNPEGEGLLPGYNSGFITLTVEGRVVRDDNTIATNTISREYQVLAKCCGASFGSGGSGGPGNAGNPQSLGADDRFCNANWGMVVGATGGSMWSWEANDRYTVRNADNSITDLTSIMGVINPTSTETTFLRRNGRMLPSPLSPAGSSDANIWSTYFTNNGDNVYKRSCRTQDARPCHGSDSDVEGSTISGIPMVPLKVTMPCIGTSQGGEDCRYAYRWPAGSGAIDGHTGITYGSSYRLRTNNDDSGNLRLEESTDSVCTPASWYPVSDGSHRLGTFVDRFGSRSYSLSGGTARWAGNWVDNETGSSAGPLAGNVQVLSALGANRLQLGNATGMQVQRAIDLSNADNLQISFNYRKSNLQSGDTLDLLLCPNGNASACESVASYTSGATADNSTLRYPPSGKVPERFLTANTLVGFRAGSGIGSGNWIYLNNIEIKASLPRDASANSFQPWCEVTNNSPVTGAPGFIAWARRS